MRQTVRRWALGLLLLHHVFAWVNIAMIRLVQLDDEAKTKLMPFTKFGARFLTKWNFFHQTVYILVALLTELKVPAKYEKQLDRLRRINWHSFWSLILPWTIIIAVVFWAVYNYDRELIFPKIVDQIFPLWLNHAVHTNILALVLLEVLFAKGKPSAVLGATATLTVHAVLYVSVLVYTFFNNHIWLYKFVGVLTWPQRIAMFLGIYVFLVATMLLGIFVQNCKHKSSVAKTKFT